MPSDQARNAQDQQPHHHVGGERDLPGMVAFHPRAPGMKQIIRPWNIQTMA